MPPARVYKNFINGEWAETRSGQTLENRNPENIGETVGIFQASGKQDVDDAVASAKSAFEKWRLVPAPKRAEIVFRAGEIMSRNLEDFARDMTREMGKVLHETRGDVQEAIDTAHYIAGGSRRMVRHTT